MRLATDGEKVKITGEVSYMNYYLDDLTSLYYTKYGDLHKYTNGEKTKIISDVDDVVIIYVAGEIYYTTSRVEEHCLMDYIEDDTAEKDATIAMPEIPNYPAEPTRSRYDSYNEYASAYNAWEREYNRPKDGYGAVREAYWGKLDRDGLRVGLKAVKIEQTKYSFRLF